MNKEQFSRVQSLISKEQFNKFNNSKVIVFGVGGVGSPCAEALVRSGLNNITLVDFDVVSISNLNRQIFTNQNNIGMLKVEALKEKLLEINPDLNCNTYNLKVDLASIHKIDFSSTDFLIDAMDDCNAKLAVIKKAKELNIKVISSMGTAKKKDPQKFQIKDISKTEMCPLAKKMRLILRNEGIKNVPVLFSTEEIVKTEENFLGSLIFLTATAGLLIANYVFNEIIKDESQM